MDPARLRNLGIAAHIDAGKTTVTERILHLCGIEHRVGRVDEGTATMDWMEEERERGITITSAATRVRWGEAEINVIDTPGHVDFTVEVERCMRVLDGAVLVIDAVAGVQAQSETVWRQMKRHGVPAIGFVNKCDKPGADVLAATQSIRDRLDAPAVPMGYPIVEGGQVTGVVEFLSRSAWTFDPDGTSHPCEIPPSLSDEIEVLRAELVDHLAEEDEELMEAVLEDRDPGLEELQAAMRRRVIAGTLVPVLCGAALRGIGVQPLLDAMVAYLPAPGDVPPPLLFAVDGETREPRLADPEESLTALAFKIHASPHGDLTFVRVYSGILRPGQKAWNPRTRTMERPGRILRMHADHGEAVEEAGPGEIVALVGCKDTGTGDTLCDRADPATLEATSFPEPVISIVVEPASSGDRDKLREALLRLAREDPSLRVVEDESAGQWTLSGMGELHLEVLTHRLQREFKIEPRIGQPRVSYREALAGVARASARVERAVAGKEVFGDIDLEVTPADEGLEIAWDAEVDLPEGIRMSVEEALRGEATSGPRFGFPLVAASIRVLGAERHRERESDVAYSMAGVQALRQAMKEAGSRILEPRMALEIESPEEFASGIIADLGSRRAEVGEVRSDGDLRTITGQVPLAEMFGYSTVVRSLSQGRASHAMTPAGFVDVPEAELEARGLTWG